MARRADLDVLDVVIASEAKQSIAWTGRHGLHRRSAPRNDDKDLLTWFVTAHRTAQLRCRERASSP
jgi:hypothetical protein